MIGESLRNASGIWVAVLASGCVRSPVRTVAAWRTRVGVVLGPKEPAHGVVGIAVQLDRLPDVDVWEAVEAVREG
ncbi:hypothetical protein GCM10010226_37950 [Streptomyces phaeofaciens]|uniref:Uncharacterized protein n=1 Tax=Streptomyces phaeofaciens TaxID=68254 RepID=A0A918HDX4_9ACTN|nr:hypothetical protein GCM10010226_37950 [Streptomyces phaeofaciens]